MNRNSGIRYACLAHASTVCSLCTETMRGGKCTLAECDMSFSAGLFLGTANLQFSIYTSRSCKAKVPSAMLRSMILLSAFRVSRSSVIQRLCTLVPDKALSLYWLATLRWIGLAIEEDDIDGDSNRAMPRRRRFSGSRVIIEQKERILVMPSELMAERRMMTRTRILTRIAGLAGSLINKMSLLACSLLTCARKYHPE